MKQRRFLGCERAFCTCKLSLFSKCSTTHIVHVQPLCLRDLAVCILVNRDQSLQNETVRGGQFTGSLVRVKDELPKVHAGWMTQESLNQSYCQQPSLCVLHTSHLSRIPGSHRHDHASTTRQLVDQNPVFLKLKREARVSEKVCVQTQVSMHVKCNLHSLVMTEQKCPTVEAHQPLPPHGLHGKGLHDSSHLCAV